MSKYVTKTYGTGRVMERDGTVRDLTAEENAFYAKPLAESLAQCKEFEEIRPICNRAARRAEAKRK